MWSDPSVTKFTGGKASTEQQTWIRLLSYIGHWAIMGFGYWAIEEKHAHNFVGEIGFADFKRDIDPAMKGDPELGFALASSYHGKGYATEAVRAALSWADANLRYRRSVCLVNEQNHASLRVLQKCGYEVFEQSSFHGEPVLFLSRIALSR